MWPGEHDDGIDDLSFRDPLPPDDRLWRHPSELTDLADGSGEGVPAPRRGWLRARLGRRRT